tara:strand:+ start:378 stop:635 length:258 start_codon:yes stop_codon:yes gene_type:complete
MEEKYYEILRHYVNPNDCATVLRQLLSLHNDRLSLFQKNKLDLLNWAKSELKQETNTKLSKTMTPYRSDKIIFLRRIIDWLNNEA